MKRLETARCPIRIRVVFAGAGALLATAGCGGGDERAEPAGSIVTDADVTDEAVGAATTVTPEDAALSAIRADDANALRSALEAGADPSFTVAGQPATHVVAARGSVDLLAVLLDAGADPDLAGIGGRSALAEAATNDQLDAVRLLLDAGADIEHRESSPGRTILQLVIDDGGSVETLGVLIDAGADMDARDDRGETALASAAFMNHAEGAALLVERGAAVDTENLNGVTPLDWARQRGNDEIAELLDAAMRS